MSDSKSRDALRPFSFIRSFTKVAPGSVLVSFGNTRVLCSASFEEKVPPFLRDSGKGWITAEYSMLPSATSPRAQREVNRGKPSGRTSEIQRLIGRSFRAVVDLAVLGEKTIHLDADVLQADGGTRTAAITGCMLALRDCIAHMQQQGVISKNPIREWVSAVSVGMVKGVPTLDLCYEEDSTADVDMNVVMTESGRFVEIQGTAEQDPFDKEALEALLGLAKKGIDEIILALKAA